ncbi:isopenicillin N synthase family dioxygenase [Rhodococcus rhodnii]|uniref:1-aminocyclopropane-1-carboxylate oxidase n=1 Tax=Rhodococcus rhodnii LMG 5362 TaxID=1273125 RepID=R7WRN9_9NOCA|nr:2-oxoglutarate and iron-dependent oxygenase domain-containing protein [Rhodococcus rhodnii]EOM76629.1 1-aminocyclopropane-1-carboxylate oxidase [Rhodococcus rhodnii LMG 5362]
MTDTFTSIPVVDISRLRSADAAERAACARELGSAAREVGFAQVVGHGITPETFDAMLTATTRFFAQSTDDKMSVYIGNSTNHRGYVPAGEEVFAGATPDLKEAYDLSIDLPSDDARYVAGNPLLGPNQWPALDDFAEPVARYYDAVFEVGRHVLRAFALALGESEDAFDRFVTTPPAQLRLIHYPHDDSAHDRPGIGAHTDYEVFTLLRPTAPGLQVLGGDGEWIDVPYREDALVLNTGDLLEIWTGGEFVATSHRVRKVATERYSFPLFFNVDYDTRIEPLPRFAGASEEYGSVVAGDHLFAQTAQSFEYLRRRVAEGAIALPGDARPLYSLGREAARAAHA